MYDLLRHLGFIDHVRVSVTCQRYPIALALHALNKFKILAPFRFRAFIRRSNGHFYPKAFFTHFFSLHKHKLFFTHSPPPNFTAKKMCSTWLWYVLFSLIFFFISMIVPKYRGKPIIAYLDFTSTSFTYLSRRGPHQTSVIFQNSPKICPSCFDWKGTQPSKVSSTFISIISCSSEIVFTNWFDGFLFPVIIINRGNILFPVCNIIAKTSYQIRITGMYLSHYRFDNMNCRTIITFRLNGINHVQCTVVFLFQQACSLTFVNSRISSADLAPMIKSTLSPRIPLFYSQRQKETVTTLNLNLPYLRKWCSLPSTSSLHYQNRGRRQIRSHALSINTIDVPRTGFSTLNINKKCILEPKPLTSGPLLFIAGFYFEMDNSPNFSTIHSQNCSV